MPAKSKSEAVEDEERIAELFNQLDVNKDGRIDIHDLTEALAKLNIPQIPGQAQCLLDHYDQNKDGGASIEEFIQYVTEHEKALRLSFESLDHNHDGYIDIDELIETMDRIGIRVDRNEALQLIRRMDKDETLTINWNEWRDFFFFHPSLTLDEIVRYWRHSTAIDIGEPAYVPDDYTEAELKTGGWWRHLVAGAVAGAVSRTCTAPLDRLKLMLMVYGSRNNPIKIVSGVNEMIREGGVLSLWRGNGINVLKIAPESALKFMAYEQVKRMMVSGSDELGFKERFVAGSIAGAFSQTVIYPMEVLKTRLALRKTGQFSGIFDCAKTIYMKEGARCFLKGYTTNLLGILPYAGIDLAVYETLKRAYIKRQVTAGDPGIFVLLVCGTLSSTCGQLASYPLALIRTKQQMNVELDGSQGSLVNHFKYILEREGPRGLYRGITPNFLKVAPAVGISYVVYEHARRFLGVEMT